jgi:hypothetical protein
MAGNFEHPKVPYLITPEGKSADEVRSANTNWHSSFVVADPGGRAV